MTLKMMMIMGSVIPKTVAYVDTEQNEVAAHVLIMYYRRL